jgi:hypothetical protein
VNGALLWRRGLLNRGHGMNKVLIVMYSRTGTSQRLARHLSQQRHWPLGEIHDPGMPGRQPRGLWQCLVDSWREREPPIRYEGPSPGDFDIVVTVSPIWVHRVAAPMRSFLSAHRPQLPQLAVISVLAGSGAPKALAEVTRMTNRRPVAHVAVTRRDVANGNHEAMLDAFSQRVDSWEPSQAPVNTHAWLAPRS